MIIEPKINYVFLDNVGHYFMPTSIIQMERSKARIVDKEIIHPITDLAIYALELAHQNGKRVTITREAILNEKIDISDLKVWEEDVTITELDTKRGTIMQKVMANYAALMNSEAFISLYDFNILNAKFASMGYFITEENKQEIYIKIIEEDNEDLLDDLEVFLEAKGRVENLYTLFKKIKWIQHELNYVKTVEEAEALFDEYVQK